MTKTTTTMGDKESTDPKMADKEETLSSAQKAAALLEQPKEWLLGQSSATAASLVRQSPVMTMTDREASMPEDWVVSPAAAGNSSRFRKKKSSGAIVDVYAQEWLAESFYAEQQPSKAAALVSPTCVSELHHQVTTDEEVSKSSASTCLKPLLKSSSLSSGSSMPHHKRRVSFALPQAPDLSQEHDHEEEPVDYPEAVEQATNTVEDDQSNVDQINHLILPPGSEESNADAPTAEDKRTVKPSGHENQADDPYTFDSACGLVIVPSPSADAESYISFSEQDKPGSVSSLSPDTEEEDDNKKKTTTKQRKSSKKKKSNDKKKIAKTSNKKSSTKKKTVSSKHCRKASVETTSDIFESALIKTKAMYTSASKQRKSDRRASVDNSDLEDQAKNPPRDIATTEPSLKQQQRPLSRTRVGRRVSVDNSQLLLGRRTVKTGPSRRSKHKKQRETVSLNGEGNQQHLENGEDMMDKLLASADEKFVALEHDMMETDRKLQFGKNSSADKDLREAARAKLKQDFLKWKWHVQLDQRQKERSERLLGMAKERIHSWHHKRPQQQLTDDDEAAQTKKPVLTEAERRDLAFTWYHRCGFPSRSQMKRTIRDLAQNGGTLMRVEDVDLLPWTKSGGRINTLAGDQAHTFCAHELKQK